MDVCVYVCVCVRACVCVIVEQGTLLTLLQSTQLLNGDLVAWCQLGKQPIQL